MKRDKLVVSLFVFLVIGCLTGVVYSAVPQSTVQTTAGGITTYVGHYGNFTESVESSEYFLSSVNKTDIFAYPQQDYSYLVWVDNSTGTPNYYAKNGTTGAIDYIGTDARTVIQNSIDSIDSKGGGKLSLNVGVYNITADIIPCNNLLVQGSGWGTVFEQGSGNVRIFSNTQIGNRYNLTFRDFSIDCNSDLYPRIDYGAPWNDHNGAGFWLGTDPNKDGVISVLLDNIKIANAATNGAYIQATEVRVTNSYVVNASSAGIEVAGDDVIISGNHLEALGHAIEVLGGLGPSKVIISDNTLIGGDGVYFQGTSSQIIMTGNIIEAGVLDSINRLPIRSSGNQNYVVCTNNEFFGYSVGTQNILYWRNYIFHDNTLFNTWFDFTGFDDNYISSIQDNILILNARITEPTGAVSAVMVRNNFGYTTENGGIDTLYNLTSSVTVAHGLDYTPTADEIGITFTSSLANCTQWWVSGIDGTNFVLNVGAAGAANKTSTNITFGWAVNRN